MSEKIYSIEEIKKMLKEILENTLVERVVLFGSYAKNEATKESDIDLIIDAKERIMGFKFIKLVMEIEDKFNKNVDGFEKCEIIKNSKIDKEIEETGVLVYEK